MTASAFLRYAAQQCFAGMPIDHSVAPACSVDFICLTLPMDADRASMRELVETRPLRFLLAAAVAESEGK